MKGEDETRIHLWTVDTLGDFFDVIHTIARIEFARRPESNGFYGQLWFRAQPKWEYSLLPTALREEGNKGAPFDGSDPATSGDVRTFWTEGNLQESWNFQRFQARAYHMADHIPENAIGWKELSQHYGGLTRYLDWSESAFTALKFALEKFLLDEPDRDQETPCVWVLNPYRLNRIGYEVFEKSEDYFRDALSEFPVKDKKLIKELQKRLQEQKRGFCPALTSGSRPTASIGLPNLSALQEMRQALGGTVQYRLQSGELPPYFYLLMRYYGDSLSVPGKKVPLLPPLAVLQPYHSVRIKAQQGAFTMFPNYSFQKDDPVKIEEIALNRQTLCHEAICCIRLRNPNRIAEEIRSAGGSAADLYPELEHLAKRIDDPPFKGSPSAASISS